MATIIFSIIGWIITIIIAVCTVRSSEKETAKQIAALEESTKKQVDSIKELARIQVELTAMQIQKELGEARTHYLHASEKNMDAMDNRFSDLGIPNNEAFSRMREKNEKEKNLHLEKDFYSKSVSWLSSILNRVEVIKKNLNQA